MIIMTCQSCGAPLDQSTADVLCPACLLRAVLDTASPDGGRSAATPGRLALPRRFGPYELIDELGRGGMGVVYRAKQPTLGRTVAVKLLLAGAYSSEAALRRFQLEAAAAAGLQHPNIVAIHDYGEVDGQPYYAMDLVAGPNLAELCSGRPLPARRAAEHLRTLAGAVEYAHRRGILHRDLKPSNVLVDEADRPRITDFGLVKLLGSTEGATMTGQMLGSPSYAAPEQAAGRFAEIGVASDVYGLGALFYHLVTGRAPFNAATPTETLRLVLDTDPPPPRLLNPSLPRDLETIGLKCLAKDPARRYATAAAVVEDVERFLAERPIRAQPPGVWYRTIKFTRRHRAGVTATAAVILALAAGLALALVGFRRAVVQRREADAARSQAEQLIGLMTEDLKPLIEQRGGLPQLLKTTEATIHYFESLPSELRNTRTDRAHADALSRLVRLRGLSFDDRKGAAEALQATLALREKIVRENPEDPEAAAALLWDEWERPRATGDRALYRKVEWHAEFYRRWQELFTRFPASLRVKRCLAEVGAVYADTAGVSDQPQEAIAAATRSRALVEELVATSPDDGSLGELVFISLRALASAYGAVRDNTKMAAIAEETLSYCASALQRDPANLVLRRRAAEAARSVSYKASQVSPRRGREAELIAREHFRLLLEANPGDMEVRARFAFTHLMESIYLAQVDGHRDAARVAINRFDGLLAALPERNEEFDPAEFRVLTSALLAQLASHAGAGDEARAALRELRGRLGIQLSRLPVDSGEFHLAQVRGLQWVLWVAVSLRDWSELTRNVQEVTEAIEAGLRGQPENIELRLRLAEMRCFRGLVLAGSGRTAEAVVGLQAATTCLRNTPRASRVFDVDNLLGIVNFTLAEALWRKGEHAEARAVAEALLASLSSKAPEGWFAREWRARVGVLVAGFLGPEEAARRLELLDRAQEILTRPEADGRLTVVGRETLATIAGLRAETGSAR